MEREEVIPRENDKGNLEGVERLKMEGNGEQ